MVGAELSKRNWDTGLIDSGCTGARLHTFKVATPSKHVCTSARHVRAQEFRQCNVLCHQQDVCNLHHAMLILISFLNHSSC